MNEIMNLALYVLNPPLTRRYPLWVSTLTGVASVRGKRAARTERGEARAEATTVQRDDFSAGERAFPAVSFFSFLCAIQSQNVSELWFPSNT